MILLLLKISTGAGHDNISGSKVHGTNMGPTWVLSAPDGPHVGPMNLAIKGMLLSTGYKGRSVTRSQLVT